MISQHSGCYPKPGFRQNNTGNFSLTALWYWNLITIILHYHKKEPGDSLFLYMMVIFTSSYSWVRGASTGIIFSYETKTAMPFDTSFSRDCLVKSLGKQSERFLATIRLLVSSNFVICSGSEAKKEHVFLIFTPSNWLCVHYFLIRSTELPR